MIRNSVRYVAAEALGRLALNTIQSVVRYQTLQQAGPVVFTAAQVSQSIIRTVFSQLGGIVADSSYRFTVFSFAELVLLSLCVFGEFALTNVQSFKMIYLNILVAISISILTPLTKSLTPEVVDDPKELVMINSLQLTVEKIARYAAPSLAALLLSTSSSLFVTWTCWCALILTFIVKFSVRFNKISLKSDSASIPEKLLAGAKILRKPELVPLVVNTLLTNVVIYPFFSVFLPIILKERDPQGWQGRLAGLNFAGVIGPLLSHSFMQSKYLRESSIEEGMITGLNIQIFDSLSIIILILSGSQLNNDIFVILAGIVMTVATAASNIFTVYFNAFAQSRLAANERGRFIANLMTLSNLANAIGSLFYSGSIAVAICVIGVSIPIRFIVKRHQTLSRFVPLKHSLR